MTNIVQKHASKQQSRRGGLPASSSIGAVLLSAVLILNTVLPGFAVAQSAKQIPSSVESAKPGLEATGLKRMEARASVPLLDVKKDRPSRPGTGTTLLDSIGRFTRNIQESEAGAWRSELQLPGLRRARAEQLRIWLAEYTLRGDEEPQKALEEIEKVLGTMPATSPLRGVATLDLGIMEFATGRYRRAADTLTALLTSNLAGFDRKGVSALAKHAIACANYHEERGRAGITEPSHIDPLCGASGLAIALRFLGKPHGKAQVVAKTPHTGFGSTMADLEVAAKNLGLVGRALKMDEAGLRAYFKVNEGIPMIVRVEHDHFVAVTAVEDKGVTYWCSDCGPWPGGKRQLTWSQWRMMEADAFLALARPDSDLAKAISLLPLTGREATWVRWMGAAWGAQRMTAQAQRILAALTTAGVAFIFFPSFLGCGLMPTTPQCVDCYPDCPYPQFTSQATADPVNLANGVEEYTAPSGLHVYNPSGPSVNWGHSYNSLAQVTPNGWGQGWHHPYLLTMYLVHYPATGSEPASTGGQIVMPNSATIGVTFSSATAPGVGQSYSGTVAPGHPYAVNWIYDATETEDFMEVVSASRTKYRFKRLVQRLNDPNAWQWYLVSITDRNGLKVKLNWAEMAFSELNQLTRKHLGMGLNSVTDASGSPLLTLAYDEDARLVSVSDRYNRSIYYGVDVFENEYGGVLGNGAIFGHDELVCASIVVPTGTVDPVVHYEYDYTLVFNSGLPQGGDERVPFLHKIRTISPTGAAGVYSQATIGYYPQAWVSWTTDGNGNRADFISNTDGSTTVEHSKNGVVDLKYSYKCAANMAWTEFRNAADQVVIRRTFADSDTPFRPSSVQVGDGVSPPTWTFNWDQYSQLLSSTTPKNLTTTISRSYANFPLGEVTEVAEGTKTSTQLTYYQPSGLVHEVKTPIPGQVGTGNRQTTTYTYDTLGNVTSVVSPGNNAGSTRTVSLNYGTNPKVGLPITVTDPLGKVSSFTYTDRGMQLTATDPLGNMSQAAYNLVDQVTSVTLPATGNSGAGNAQVLNTYLFVGGPLTQTRALDEAGGVARTVDYTYGHEAELLTRTGSTEPVTLTYNSAYMTKAVADGNSNSTLYTYNQNGQLTKISYPGATGLTYDQIQFSNFDILGRALTRLDGRGQETNYTYADTDLNLSTIAYVADPSQNVAITYDTYDRVTQVSDGTGVATATYDDLGLTASATRTYTGLSAKTSTYAYYPDGSRQSMVNPAGTWSYLYDLNGRCTSMTSPAGTSGISYLDNGWIFDRTLPNGSTTRYEYNPLGLLTSLVNKKSDGTVQSSYSASGYDSAFNLSGIVATVNGASGFSGTTSWTHDTKDRLTNETSNRQAGWNQNNAYDGASNPTTFANLTRTYNANNQFTMSGNTYDGNGNPTTYAGAAFTYDVENRVTSTAGALLTSGYRADGLRAWKQAGSSPKTYFLYDGGNPVVELDGSGNVKHINVYAPDGLVGRKEGSSWYYYTFDQQGNVSQKFDANQTIKSTRLCNAWGEGMETENPRSPDVFGYNAKWGYYLDRDTELYVTQHRMYDASTGRFLNRDPIGYAGGVNLYGYCGQGPVGSADPSGLWKTGSYGGDVWSVIQGYGDAVIGALKGAEPANALINAGAVIGNPAGYAQGALEEMNPFSGDDPRVMGRRFAPWIPMLAGMACKAPPLAGRATSRSAPRTSGPRISHLSPDTGVPIDMEGYPVFAVEAEVYIKPTGTHAGDARAANKAMGWKATPADRTWHHHQDFGRMQLVDRDLHRRTLHKGGFSIWGMQDRL